MIQSIFISPRRLTFDFHITLITSSQISSQMFSSERLCRFILGAGAGAINHVRETSMLGNDCCEPPREQTGLLQCRVS